MLLTIDVGNTNMVFGIFENRTLIGSFRLTTDTNRTSDEIGMFAYEYFTRFNLKVEKVKDVIIASVVPQVMYSLTSAIIKYFNRNPVIVDDDVDPGLPYKDYKGNERLGADRVVSCIAAHAKYGGPLILMDFGTATTVDVVGEDGAYLGGVILAGIKISMEALFMKTAMLPRVELIKPDRIIHLTTVGQIQAGAICGYVGSMEYIVRQMKMEINCQNLPVIATGGLARLMMESSDLIDVMDSQLSLDGLRMIHEKYKKERLS